MKNHSRKQREAGHVSITCGEPTNPNRDNGTFCVVSPSHILRLVSTKQLLRVGESLPDITVCIENFHLHAIINHSAKSYAFNVYLGNEIIHRMHYQSENTLVFQLPTAGLYRVRGYARDTTGSVSAWASPSVRFKGLPKVPEVPQTPIVAIVGVSGASATAAHIISASKHVSCFVDPTGEYVGSEFFGRPVVASPPPNQPLIGHENYAAHFPEMTPYTLESGAADVISRELHRRSAMELYRMAREAYLGGLTEAANHIQSFIFSKFNSRVPYLAQIGEGTKFGYGGIGVVIHTSAVIGTNCLIAQNVTLGARPGGEAPNIGNNVYISPGAVCLGGEIGNNVVVGANSVVLSKVADNSVVAGAPARVISTSSDKYTAYTVGRRK